MEDVSGVVSGIASWPPASIRDDSSTVVNSFDTFGENLVTGDNFSEVTIVNTRLLFTGVQVI